MEVDRFWCAGSHTWASIVFLVLRYLALLGHVPLLYAYNPCEEVSRTLPAFRLFLILRSSSARQSLRRNTPSVG